MITIIIADPRTPRISLCAQVADLTRCANPRTSEELDCGTAFRRAQHSRPCGPLAPASSRLDAAGGSWSTCVEVWGPPLSWPGHRNCYGSNSMEHILTQPRLPRFRCKAQCKMQLLEKPSMVMFDMCFTCANASLGTAGRAPSATSLSVVIWLLHIMQRSFRPPGDVIDCPKARVNRPTLS